MWLLIILHIKQDSRVEVILNFKKKIIFKYIKCFNLILA